MNNMNAYPAGRRYLPSAVIAGVATIAFSLSGCSGEGTPQTVKTVTESARPTGDIATGSSDHGTADPTGESSHQGNEYTTDPQPSDQVDIPHGTGTPDAPRGHVAPTTPAATADKPKPTLTTHKPAEQSKLHFSVVGECPDDGELQNDSYNFTPRGQTVHTIKQPDGNDYPNVINNNYGWVDGTGHSQWHWPCDTGDMPGTYSGVITDFGPDRKLGTPDDRSVSYSFVGN